MKYYKTEKENMCSFEKMSANKIRITLTDVINAFTSSPQKVEDLKMGDIVTDDKYMYWAEIE